MESFGDVRTIQGVGIRERDSMNRKKRIAYGIVTLCLLIIEVLIALFVHDDFIRPYIGDVLVVIVLYTFIRIWVVEKCRLLPIYICVFAVIVEVLQYFEIVKILHLENNAFFRILLGSVFDVKDIVCYAVGGIILCGYEILLERRKKKTMKNNYESIERK